MRSLILWLLVVVCLHGASAHADAPASGEVGRLVPPLCEPQNHQCYRDTDGLWRDPQRVYELELSTREPHVLRAFGWTTVLLAGGTLWYWLDRDKNAVDWDFDSWKARFDPEAYRFDANDFPINWLWHPLSGAAFHALARSNDLDVLSSFAVSFVGSFVWEFFLEFKERVSLNDMLVTPVAGIPLGEYFARLGRYLSSAPGGGGRKHRALRWSLGLPLALHQAWDGTSPPPADAPADARGFGSDISADFVFGLETRYNRASGQSFPLHGGFLESRLIAIPGFMREGDFRFVFTDANLSSLSLQLNGGHGWGGKLFSEAVIAGVHRQRVRWRGSQLAGEAVTAGVSVNYLYRRYEYDDFEDLVSSVGLVGLTLEGRMRRGNATLVAGLRVHPEFASLSSPAYGQWRQEHPNLQTKTVLERSGYYYGWGGATRLMLEARLPWLRAGTSLLAGAYRSQDGVDRNQGELEVDFPLRDRQLYVESVLAVVIPRVGLYLGVAHTALFRRSRVPEINTRHSLQQLGVRVGLAR